MEWIKIQDRLPEEGSDCWIHIVNDGVNSGFYKNKCGEWDDNGDFSYFKGFCLCDETSCYVPNEEITHWMPYYTPDPPKD